MKSYLFRHASEFFESKTERLKTLITPTMREEINNILKDYVFESESEFLRSAATYFLNILKIEKDRACKGAVRGRVSPHSEEE